MNINLDGQRISGGIYALVINYNPTNQAYYMIKINVGAENFFVKTNDLWSSWSERINLPDVYGIDPSFFLNTISKSVFR